MTIALPTFQDRISPLLDAATRLLVVTFRGGAVVRRREVLLGPMPPDALARSVAELHVNLLLCGALSEPVLRELHRQQVKVRPHLCGEVDAVLRAYCAGRLDRGEFDMPGCHCRHVCRGVSRSGRPARHAAGKPPVIKPGILLI